MAASSSGPATGYDGGLNLYDWDKGYGEPHPMYATVIPDTSINIANLEAKLGRKYTANSMYYQRLSYGTCPEEFYIKYSYLGRDKDSFTLEKQRRTGAVKSAPLFFTKKKKKVTPPVRTCHNG